MAAQIARSFEDSARAAFREPNARDMTTSKDWDHIDYWYDRQLEVASPAAQTANPSGLALIAFAVTTILLQVSIVSSYLTIPFACAYMPLLQQCLHVAFEEVTRQQLCV